ncbi:hypothetical protein [Ferrimonas marina]|uniref:Uncharacterized protein n=1 Tax=Ferrimonas marina TaxID=299255 RepID=A0A1M5U6I6_9GAMM|nr:hypothetical protein [Ferrimonas marina]SHH58574.1 hypothetical protein SAMN02745129_2428 [Ferrimonas marina]
MSNLAVNYLQQAGEHPVLASRSNLLKYCSENTVPTLVHLAKDIGVSPQAVGQVLRERGIQWMDLRRELVDESGMVLFERTRPLGDDFEDAIAGGLDSLADFFVEQGFGSTLDAARKLGYSNEELLGRRLRKRGIPSKALKRKVQLLAGTDKGVGYFTLVSLDQIRQDALVNRAVNLSGFCESMGMVRSSAMSGAKEAGLDFDRDVLWAIARREPMLLPITFARLAPVDDVIAHFAEQGGVTGLRRALQAQCGQADKQDWWLKKYLGGERFQRLADGLSAALDSPESGVEP